MANAPRSGRRSQGNRSTRNRQGGNRQGSNRQRRSRRTSTQQSSAPGGNTHSRHGTLTRPDTGYTLHSRRVRRENTGIGTLLTPRIIAFCVIVLVVFIVIIAGISSCVRGGGESAPQATEETQPKNEQDARVASGVPAAVTSQFTEALDQADLLRKIAKNADKYKDDRMLKLALNEPDAIPFVANYPTSDKSSTPYDGVIKRGEVPLLYNWDSHWGAVTYGDGPVAITGSGPTTLAMAYMGLTGKADNTPTEIAQQASKSNYAEGESGSKAELFSKFAATLGLTTEPIESSENMIYSLDDKTVIAAEVKADTLTDEAHWVLVVNVNNDGSLTVYDPTSSAVSSTHNTWSPGTIANAATSMYTITISDEELEKLESETSSSASGTSGASSANSNRRNTSSSADDEEDADADAESTADEEDTAGEESASTSSRHSLTDE
ncbi:MAG: hypothetical protein IKG21_06340 [Atopobiaceae bacterium]|nr:hypothetical protein [Atopobiaceae bacterium]